MPEKGVLIRDITTAPVVPHRLLGQFTVLITVHDAPASPAQFCLKSGAAVLGAGSEADIVISDDTVSRKHLQVSITPDGIELLDLNSTNGTYSQGLRVQRLTLDRRAAVVLGRVRVSIDPQVKFQIAPGSESAQYGELLGDSLVMRQLFSTLRQLESSTVPLMLEGEAGCGKGTIALEIHRRSPLSRGAFHKVDCTSEDPSAAFAAQMVQLVRRVREPTTDLPTQGGSIFFANLDAAPLSVQAQLARILEQASEHRGAAQHGSAGSLRIIASSRRPLQEEVAAGRFHNDLLHRLNVLVLRVPALRERQADIALLSKYFAARHGVLRLPPRIVEQLGNYGWPGNVRELHDVMRGYAELGEFLQGPLQDEDQLVDLFKRVVNVSQSYQQQKDYVLNKFLEVYLSLLLEHAGGNQSLAARLSGIERAHLNRMLAKQRSKSDR